MSDARFVVGIDLGTTNCALAFVDTADGEKAKVQRFPVPQVVQPGQVATRATLPSFLYRAAPSELPAGALDLPWLGGEGRTDVVGDFARAHGWQTPARLVSSAKSWLCHAGVDRTAAILPWGAPDEVAKLSPVDASTQYLAHLRDAWNAAHEEDRLEGQDVFLTVPASFDAAARELTVNAAGAAGLTVTLLEEPQAAFYAFLAGLGDAWRKELRVGDVVLVADVGGGTTDFSLIAVNDRGGNLELERVAVGDHILLGGDNMDLALAFVLQDRLAKEGTKLDAWQARSLAHSCRVAKEALLSGEAGDAHPVAVLGRGSKVIGGSIKTELQRADVETVLVEGFFPRAAATDRPKSGRRGGLTELGLPFAQDPAVTRHLAAFLAANGAKPTAMLSNGGVMKSASLRSRLFDVLAAWGSPARPLVGTDLDLAVAMGAAYYGVARRGRGVRIRAGTARSYYVGIESSMPAVPGFSPPLKALCVAPFGMEEGTEAPVTEKEFGLVVGEEARFRFLSSTTRRADKVGELIEEPGDDIAEISPVETELPAVGGAKPGDVVPVRMVARVTEIGTLELWCVARDGGQRWKLEYNVREASE